MTTITLSYRQLQSKVAVASTAIVNWKLWYIAAALLLGSMVVVYIVLVNDLTEGTYLIKQHTKEMAGVAEENRALEAEFAQTGFLGSVQDQVRQQGFEKTTSVQYTQLLQPALAQR